MIRIAATGDSHFDVSSRWEECLRIHDWMADDMTARKVDLFIHCGDWFERGSKIEERNAVRAWLQRVAEERPVIGVKGNHDSLGDLDIFNHIRSDYPHHKIVIEESARVHFVKLANNSTVAVAAVAWPQKAQLLSMLDRAVSYEESEGEARHCLQTMMLGLRDQLAAHDGPRILAMHAMVSGSRTSVGQPLVGCDLEVSLEDLALCEPDLILLGHIHKPQEWTVNGIPVIYCGSPYATAYGETEPKGYVIAEFSDETFAQRINGGDLSKKPSLEIISSKPSRIVNWQRIETPRTPMVLLETKFNPESRCFEAAGLTSDEMRPIDELLSGELAGADVRFRYSYDSEFRDAAAVAVQGLDDRLRLAGATAVKVEGIKNATTRSRAPEIAQAVDVIDKLPILWKVKGTEPEPERAARLLSMARTLQTES